MTVVSVVGPPLSGTSAVAAALRRALNGGCDVTESASGAPDVVVFVVSAAAPLSACDAARLDAAAVETDAVVAVVAKTDVHRTWRAVLEDSRAALARHAPRYRTTPWVGVAAEPQIGQPVIEPLVDAVRAALADDGRADRNRLRAASARTERAATRRAQAAQRDALRADVRHARLELGAQARAAAVSLRAELQQRAAVATRSDIAEFDGQVRRQVSRTVDHFDHLVRSRFAELCSGRDFPVPIVTPAPPLWDGLPPSRRPASDTMNVLFAATFGLSVVLTLGRLLVELVGGAAPWALGGCGAVGLGLTVWVVRTRRLAAARLAADRWVAEVSAGLRSALVDRVLAAESSLLAAIAAEGRSPN